MGTKRDSPYVPSCPLPSPSTSLVSKVWVSRKELSWKSLALGGGGFRCFLGLQENWRTAERHKIGLRAGSSGDREIVPGNGQEATLYQPLEIKQEPAVRDALPDTHPPPPASPPLAGPSSLAPALGTRQGTVWVQLEWGRPRGWGREEHLGVADTCAVPLPPPASVPLPHRSGLGHPGGSGSAT